MSDQRPEIQRLTESFDEGGYLGIAATTDDPDWLLEMHGKLCAIGDASEAFLAAEGKVAG